MKKIAFLMIATCLLFLNSCKKEDQSIEDQSFIEPDFREYVDRFVYEADLRNIKIDISKLKVRYGDTLKHIIGIGWPNDVLIQSSYWKNRPDAGKEILLFHELGHAILRRLHDNSKLPNGDFKTMMGEFLISYSEFTPERRKYYLDELFIPSTPAPAWAAIKTIPTIIYKDTIQSGSPIWTFINQPGNTFNGKFYSTAAGTSLLIEPSYNLEGWAKWQLIYIPQGINQSDKLVLSARIKTVGVTKGGGVTLWFGGYDVNNDVVFSNFRTDSGTMDFTEWKAEIPYYVSAKSIYIKFVLDRSQGIAYLDDVTLTKFE